MLFIIILAALYIFLGFMLAWIAMMVAREEVTVGTGIFTLIAAGIMGWLIDAVLDMVVPAGALQTMVHFAVILGTLTLALHLIAKLEWKHSFLISVIYAVVINGVLFALASCIAATA